MPYLSSWWTNLSDIFLGSIKRVKLKVYQIYDKLVHQEPKYGCAAIYPSLVFTNLKTMAYLMELIKSKKGNL